MAPPFAFFGGSPALALLNALRAYNPTLLLLGDVGTLQTGGAASVAGDGSLTTSQVGTWQDQSGNANHAAQGTSTMQGRLLSSDASGRRVVSFDGVDDGMLSGATVNVNPVGYSIIAVERPHSGGGSCRTICTPDQNALFSLVRSTGDQFYFNSDVVNVGGSVGTAGVLSVASLSCATSGNVIAHKNNTDITNASIGIQNWGRVAIGTSGQYAEPANTDLAAVVVVPYSARLAATALLASYYGITIS